MTNHHSPHCNVKHLRLVYIGLQEFPGNAPIALWNLEQNGHPANRSTLSLQSLVSYGLVRV